MIATVSRRKPSLLVRWTAPIGHDISYVVRYSATNQNTPPNDALEVISYYQLPFYCQLEFKVEQHIMFGFVLYLINSMENTVEEQ